MTIENASQFPRTYYCRHMQPGTALYEREGIVLVDTDAMKGLISSVGKRSIPVYLGHQPVDLQNIKDQACGYVSDSFYNESDGWAWFKFIAVDDKAHEAIKKGWSVSNAYMPTETGPGGTKNNVPYRSEVRNGEFTHLAIVPDPRYEGALIMNPDEFRAYQDDHRAKLSELKNSKETKTMLKLFKTERKEVSTIDADTEVELTNGKTATIQEMVNALEASEKAKQNVVMVNGKEMTVEELTNAYCKMNKKTKKNSDEKVAEEGEEEPKSKEEEAEGKRDEKKNKKMKKNEADDMGDDDDVENEADDEDEAEKDEKKEVKKNKKEKTNSIDIDKDDKYFKEMRNAHILRANQPTAMISSSIDQIERGRQRYGSNPVKK